MPLLPLRARNLASRLLPHHLAAHPALLVGVACSVAIVTFAAAIGPAASNSANKFPTALARRSTPAPSSPGAGVGAGKKPSQGIPPPGRSPSPSSTLAGVIPSPHLAGASATASTPPQFATPTGRPSSRLPSPTPSPSPPVAAHGNAWRGIGFFPGEGDGQAAAQKFRSLESWLGRSVPFIVTMTDTRDPQSFRSSVWGHFLQSGAGDLGSVRPRSVVSVPLSFGGLYPSASTGAAQLQAVASGQFDDSYAYLGQALVTSGNSNAIIRLGWEFDGDWMPWSASNNPQLYVAAFRHVHDLLRSISGAFQFDFCGDAGYRWPIPRGNSHTSWDAVYPGDAYVDIVGMDVYNDSSNWSYFQQTLADQLAFATAHGKRVSFPEWALDTRYGDKSGWVQNMLNWMDSLPSSGPGSLAYQSWFNGDNSNGRFSLDNFAQGGALFRSRMS